METGGPEVQASCTFHTHYSFLQLVSTLSIFYPHLLLVSIVIRGQIFLTASLSFVLCTFEVCIQGFKFLLAHLKKFYDRLRAKSCLVQDGNGAGGGPGGYSKKFYTGRLRPKVQPLTLLYTIFFRKGTHFIYLLRRLMNKSLKQEVFLLFFSHSV